MSEKELDRAKLRKIAEAATPGPWDPGKSEKGDSPAMVYCDDATGQRVADCTGRFLFFTQEQMKRNAAHIAAFDPPTVLALIDKVSDAQTRIAELEDATGEAYQAVGALADELGLFEDERFQKILDLLAYGKGGPPET